MLHKITSLGLLAFLSLAAAAKTVDLTTKKGYLLYKASYKNTADQRTKAFSDTTYVKPGPVTLTNNESIAYDTLYNFKVEKKDWFNIFTIQSITFPPDTLKTGFVPAGQTLLDETYSVTALDPSSKKQIGSLVFAASYAAAASGTVTGAAKVAYPVLGASGVFKQAKSVVIEYKTDAERTRDISIYKNTL